MADGGVSVGLPLLLFTLVFQTGSRGRMSYPYIGFRSAHTLQVRGL